MTRTRRFPILMLVLAVGFSLPTALAVAQGSDDLATRAASAIQSSDWAKAVELYSELTAATPEDPVAWYRLGLATANLGGDGPAARAAYEKALALGFGQAPALWGIAKSHMIDDETDAALATLERLAQQGPSAFVVSRLGTDEAFASLRSNARFQAVVKSLTPCTSHEYRQFDFWLGSWDVVSPQGQTLGTNTVTRTMDGCVLMESWESAQGGQKGMSINYYDRDKRTWSQIYRDNSGNVTQWPELVGGLIDGAMVLDSGPDTQPRTRWTWSKESDGRVRQMAESTTDGESWNVVWDSYYVPAGK